MKRVTAKQIAFLQDKLLEWYKHNGRHFAWRNKSINNYQKVIAEVLLQRTKAETVDVFFKQFVKDYPNWQTLADAKQKDLEIYLKPIGLYRQRAKRIKLLAAEMVKRNGRLPRNREELEAIPFMGQYIANAVELVVFNQPSPLIDVNMARVIERYFGPRQLADIRYDPYLQQTAYRLANHTNAKLVNWAVLDFAAEVCKAKLPECDICVLKSQCMRYKNIRH